MASLLRIEHLTKSFGGLQAVLDVSFAVREGSITGLIGPNGSGKTVTFDCITGFYRPDRGRVFLGDRELTGLRPHRIARAGIARSFQITGVFPRLTVRQNLQFSMQEKRLLATLAPAPRAGKVASRTRVDSALSVVGLDDLADAPVASLAYGQQKFLELAGLMLMRPAPTIYLLDEPFAGLTQTDIARYIGLMEELRGRGKTFLIVEHNMRVMMTLCDAIVALDHGEKIADGSPGAVQANARVIEAYLGHAGAARDR